MDYSLRRLLAFLILLFGAGCAGTNLAPAQPLAATTVAPTRISQPTATVTLTATATASRPTLTPIPTDTPVSSESALGFGYGPVNFPEGINPLTGLKVSDLSILERRPLVIKITNFPRQVRPQWGLNSADHIYEYYLEDDLTRFIGIFYGRDASQVGPIRSARPFDMHIVRAYKGVFVFGFADSRIYNLLMESEFSNRLVLQRPDNCPPLCRIGESRDYNNLFTDTALMSQYITERGTSNGPQDVDGLRFEEKTYVVSGGGGANRVAIRFSVESYNRWEYDPISQQYLRFQESQSLAEGQEAYLPLFDSLSGKQVAADNLIILFVKTDYYFRSHSTEIFDIQLEGEGEAYALRQGKIFRINWQRQGRDAVLVLKFANGTPYPLRPGNIWFEVMGATTYYERAGDEWKFTFSFP